MGPAQPHPVEFVNELDEVYIYARSHYQGDIQKHCNFLSDPEIARILDFADFNHLLQSFTSATMPSGTVFITGATGFIGSHVAKSTLAAGYRVRLSIRKAEQQETLEKILAPHAENAEFLVVPDLSNADALRDALKGVDYVFHLASPMPGKGSDIKTDYVEPAERNTLAILEAAQAQQASIKKVVITASVLSLMPLGSLAYPEFSVAGMQNAYHHLIRLSRLPLS